ncbi:selenocysteine lyase isoform 2-T3 [Anomaloglossus baeobatrachus]
MEANCTTAKEKQWLEKEEKQAKCKVYLDYNATTPPAAEVIDVVTQALQEAWGNPSSSYSAGCKAKQLIDTARAHIAQMVGARPEDIIYTSGGTEANNMVLFSAVDYFNITTKKELINSLDKALPHIITSNVEHDSITLPLKHLQGAHRADAAQALGKISVDVQKLGVHYLTIVGHKFYGPRIGALYVQGIGNKTPLLPMLHGGGQERNYRPGTENTPMIAGLGKAAELVSLHCAAYENHMRSVRDHMEQRLQTAFGNKIRFNSHFSGTERLPNTCNVSLLRPAVLGREWLSHCDYLLASVGAACHSDREYSPSHVLLSSGVSLDAARGAIRLSVGRDTTREDVDLIVRDLEQAAQRLENETPKKEELKK